MSKTRPPVEAAEEKVEKATGAAPTEPTFTVEQLRKSARSLFNVSQSTYDGATYGLTGEFTVEAMRKHIDEWLKEVY